MREELHAEASSLMASGAGPREGTGEKSAPTVARGLRPVNVRGPPRDPGRRARRARTSHSSPAPALRRARRAAPPRAPSKRPARSPLDARRATPGRAGRPVPSLQRDRSRRAGRRRAAGWRGAPRVLRRAGRGRWRRSTCTPRPRRRRPRRSRPRVKTSRCSKVSVTASRRGEPPRLGHRRLREVERGDPIARRAERASWPRPAPGTARAARVVAAAAVRGGRRSHASAGAILGPRSERLEELDCPRDEPVDSAGAASPRSQPSWPTA